MAADPAPQATPGQAFRATLIDRWSARGRCVDGRTWDQLPAEDQADMEAAADAAAFAAIPALGARLADFAEENTRLLLTFDSHVRETGKIVGQRDEARAEAASLRENAQAGRELTASYRLLEAERDSLRIQAAQLQAGHNALATRNAELGAELDKVAVALDAFDRIVISQARSMYAALIDVRHGRPTGAAAILFEALDGFDGPQLNDGETGVQWLERTRGEDDGDAAETAAILADPETMTAIAEGLSELEGDGDD